MREEVLLQFLEAGLLDIGSDDTRLEKLRTTVKELVAALKKEPAQTVPWTLVAVDPKSLAEDQVIAEAWSVLKKNWTTVANSYQATPVALLRAALLDALVQTGAKEPTVAVAFANTSRNMLPHMPLGNEGPVWLNAIAEIEDVVDERADAEWITPERIQLPSIVYKSPDNVEINAGDHVTNRETLHARILSASGPNGVENQNPHWPHNQPQQWSREFADRLADAVADAIDGVSKANKIAPVDLSTPLAALADTVSDHVAKALDAFSGATAGLQRRTNLLWWKEALYSASSRASYRDMHPFSAASLMALDLFEQVPLFSPASVSAFLNEAIQNLPDVQSAEARDVPAIIAGLLEDPVTEPLRKAAHRLQAPWKGRSLLLSVIGHCEVEALGGIAFRRVTGLDDKVVMRPDAWGAHMFRELQASRATQASAVKRGRGKA